MGKVTEEVEVPVDEQTQQNDTNALLAELNAKGKITLSAKTREELQELAVALIEASNGTAYAAGAAGYDDYKDVQVITIMRKEE